MAEDLSATAAEYVLGTLDAAERRDFLRLIARDPAAVAAVRFWQDRLAPLALAIDPVAPPPFLEPRILAATGGPVASPPVVANDNSAWRWRLATVAASLVAVVAAGLALRPQDTVMPLPKAPPAALQPIAFQPTAFAALSEKGETPGLFVTYDRTSGRLKIVPVGLTPDQAHSYELWLIEGKNAPRPMGLVAPGKVVDRRMSSAVPAGTVLAVSREPVGGSSTGLPTGPVLFSGPLVAMSPET